MQDPTGAYVRALPRPDGVELYVRDFLGPAGTQARGLLVMVHGWSWHSRYFQPAAEHFVQQGAPPPCSVPHSMIRARVSAPTRSFESARAECLQCCCCCASLVCNWLERI